MKISIVIAYYNRKKQLLKSLESIWHYGNPEIIIIDDGSTERIDDIEGIKLIRIEPEEKWYSNPCIPFNIGLSKAEGDIIIIQNPECIHIGNILSYCKKLIPDTVFSFAAYSLDFPLEYDNYNLSVLKNFIMSLPQQRQVSHQGWYNHSIYRPEALHFCNAFMREDIERIGGFDERYANGICFDDNDLVVRIRRAKMKIDIIDNPFVIHQQHERTDYAHLWNKRMINFGIFEKAGKETCIKPPNNKYYGLCGS
jgi:GT2 family glycosyltransferase